MDDDVNMDDDSADDELVEQLAQVKIETEESTVQEDDVIYDLTRSSATAILRSIKSCPMVTEEGENVIVLEWGNLVAYINDNTCQLWFPEYDERVYELPRDYDELISVIREFTE